MSMHTLKWLQEVTISKPDMLHNIDINGRITVDEPIKSPNPQIFTSLLNLTRPTDCIITFTMAGIPSHAMMDYGPHHHLQHPSFHTTRPDVHLQPGDVGILKSTLLPSFGIYSGLSIATFAAAKATDRVELKDWLWPSGQVLNAWWSAIGRPMYETGIPLATAWGRLSWTEKVLLGSVTLWGSRLFARIASRSLVRGKDDARYDAVKKQPGFWRTALLKIFIPEAVFLSVISLPFTVPFNISSSKIELGACSLKLVRALGVGLFGAGFALESLADAQLELHCKERDDLCRHGVWSLVRHPKYVSLFFFEDAFCSVGLC